jgi:hypothetical protein
VSIDATAPAATSNAARYVGKRGIHNSPPENTRAAVSSLSTSPRVNRK